MRIITGTKPRRFKRYEKTVVYQPQYTAPIELTIREKVHILIKSGIAFKFSSDKRVDLVNLINYLVEGCSIHNTVRESKMGDGYFYCCSRGKLTALKFSKYDFLDCDVIDITDFK